jgi:hypothetical protein
MKGPLLSNRTSKEGSVACARELLHTYLRAVEVDPDTLAASIEALNDCARACATNADADLSEPNASVWRWRWPLIF